MRKWYQENFICSSETTIDMQDSLIVVSGQNLYSEGVMYGSALDGRMEQKQRHSGDGELLYSEA